MSDTKDKIIQTANHLFYSYGVRSVSMDDIARELSMSKKTIYQFVKDKNEIVQLVMLEHINHEKEEFEAILGNAGNALDEIFKLSKCLKRHMGEINPSLLFDLQKFHPESWELWVRFKQDFIKNAVLNVINRGKSEGYFRENLNAEILAIFRIESIELTFDQKIFPKDQFDFTELQMTIFDHFVHGLLTIKGQEIYDDMINSIKND